MILLTEDNNCEIFEHIKNIIKNKIDLQIFETEMLEFPRLRIDQNNYKVYTDNKEVILTHLQFQLLLFLAKKPGRVFTYEQIYEAVWGNEYAYEKGNIMAQIRHIRKKIQPDYSFPEYIENVRGIGYRFIKEYSHKSLPDTRDCETFSVKDLL